MATLEEQYKHLVYRVYDEAFNRGKLETIDDVFSPVFIDQSTPEQEAGRAGVREYVQLVRTGFPDLHVKIEDILAEGKKVAVRTVWQGTHTGSYEGIAPTGKKVARSLLQIFRVQDGLLTEEWNEGVGLADLLHCEK